MATYRVFGEAHGAEFDEKGFPTLAAAEAYASSVIDGDYDSTIQIIVDPDDEDLLTDYLGYGANDDDYPPGFFDQYDYDEEA